MKTLQLTLLGGFEARVSGQWVDVRSNKTKALLAHLALTLGKSHSRGELAALLWGDRSEEQARHSLRQELNVLRRTLGAVSEPALRVERAHIALGPTDVEVDVDSAELNGQIHPVVRRIEEHRIDGDHVQELCLE